MPVPIFRLRFAFIVASNENCRWEIVSSRILAMAGKMMTVSQNTFKESFLAFLWGFTCEKHIHKQTTLCINKYDIIKVSNSYVSTATAKYVDGFVVNFYIS